MESLMDFKWIKSMTLVALLSLGVTLVGCQKASEPQLKATAEASPTPPTTPGKVAEGSTGVVLVAPQYAMVSVAGHTSLIAPVGVSIADAQWNFGDGSPPQSGPGPFDHIFYNVGVSTVSVVVTDSLGNQETLTQPINVIGYSEGLLCISELSLTANSSGMVGEPLSMAVNIPACMTAGVTGVRWNFSDGSIIETTAAVSHIFTTAGTFNVSVEILMGSTTPQFTLTRSVVVTDSTPPPPPPPPTEPLACTTPTATRSVIGANYTEVKTCGTGGSQSDIYRDLITQTCTLQPGEVFRWIETSRVKELVSAGECTGQACALPGGGTLAHNTSGTFYSTTAPSGSCTEVSEVRTCNNGILSGTTQFTSLTCQGGCPGFGPNGSVQSGVVTGQIVVPRVCPFSETGINDIYLQISDKTCVNGGVVTSNPRQGSLVSAGVCPGYSWTASESFTTCSAACGGQQSQLYICKDSLGNAVDASRCTGAAPVVTRLCDGDPDSVKRSETITTPEDGGSSNQCPANQIGVISKSRTSTTVTDYACINHAVSVAAQATTFSDWVIENHCRDYVAYRCSKDSLSNSQAMGRLNWMKKCAKTVPLLQEFLDDMNGQTVVSNGRHNDKLEGNARMLYPTFMIPGPGGVDISWRAPTNPSESCTIPANAYISAVCVASCSTPEQLIRAQEAGNGKLHDVPFFEAWQKKFAFVGSLQSSSSMSSKSLQKTAVEQWVTELEDTTQVILEFQMKSGGSLRITPNHPLLGPDAIMREASTFKVGESLLQIGAIPDEIISITSTDYFGKVYNVFVKSAALHHNVIVINGYLNGTAYFQNEGAQHLNRQVLRTRLVKGVLSK